MNEARKKELTNIKNEKKKRINEIQAEINKIGNEAQYTIEQLNKSLRITADEHNRAAWGIEELDRLENPSVGSEKELIEAQEKKDA